MSRVAEEKIPDCDCAKPVGTRTTFLFFWVLCVCWMRVWAEVRLFGSVSRSRLTKFQLSYKKRSKRQAHIANTFCSLACVHVCVASFWVRRTYVKHAAVAARPTAGHRRRFMDTCAMCVATQGGMCVVRHTKPAFYSVSSTRTSHTTQASLREYGFDTHCECPRRGDCDACIFFFILSLDFAKLDGELAARDTRICATPYAHGIDGKKRRRRKTEKRRFEWFVLTISTRNFSCAVFLPIRIADIIFFFSACVYECALCAQNFQN